MKTRIYAAPAVKGLTCQVTRPVYYAKWRQTLSSKRVDIKYPSASQDGVNDLADDDDIHVTLCNVRPMSEFFGPALYQCLVTK